MSKLVTRPRLIGAAVLCVVAASGLGAGLAIAAQPHMNAALSDLVLAKGELSVAAHNKAGHRWKALADVNAAIAEVNLGIAAGEE